MRYVLVVAPLALLTACGGSAGNTSGNSTNTNSVKAAAPAGPVMMEEKPAPGGAPGTVTRQVGPTLIPPADPRLADAFSACALARVGQVPDASLNAFCTCMAEGTVNDQDFDRAERACATRMGVTLKGPM